MENKTNYQPENDRIDIAAREYEKRENIKAMQGYEALTSPSYIQSIISKQRRMAVA